MSDEPTCCIENRLEFVKLEATDEALIKPYLERRDIDSCEYCFATFVLWDNRYNISYYLHENYALFMEVYDGLVYALMPVCEARYFEEALEALARHFEAIGQPLAMFVADKVFADYMRANHGDDYEITTNRDEYDYLYDANALRSLGGKKLRKKRNHVNGFLRDYEGRWSYEVLTDNNEQVICKFMKRWADRKGESEEMLDDELTGVCDLLEHMDQIDLTVGAIYIDGQLEALTMGSVVNNGKEAVIHVEKADPEIRGLYQMINQQFLINSVPDVEIVNREDDVGIEGLRRAKLSYYPIGFAEKFNIKAKN